MWPERSSTKQYRVTVSLMASRQLARVPAEVARQVRQKVHAVAERAPRTAGERRTGEPLSLHVQVERYVAHVDINPQEGVVTLRDVDTSLW